MKSSKTIKERKKTSKTIKADVIKVSIPYIRWIVRKPDTLVGRVEGNDSGLDETIIVVDLLRYRFGISKVPLWSYWFDTSFTSNFCSLTYRLISGSINSIIVPLESYSPDRELIETLQEALLVHDISDSL